MLMGDAAIATALRLGAKVEHKVCTKSTPLLLNATLCGQLVGQSRLPKMWGPYHSTHMYLKILGGVSVTVWPLIREPEAMDFDTGQQMLQLLQDAGY